jgi:four helix bundle protein
MNKKIKSFTDLNVWRKAHELVIFIYKIADSFPAKEQYGLTNQICRAAVSITSNIAEGFARHTYQEKIRFYSIALGSVAELQNQLLISKDIKYLEIKKFKIAADKSVEVYKMLNAFITKTKSLRDSK